jgi:hypothetical protein
MSENSEESQDLALIVPEDLSLVENNALNGHQLKLLLKHTPKQYVKTRPAKGGGTWEYVTGGYVRKVLNLLFGWNWSFEILGETVYPKEVVVKGRLTCTSNGVTVTKTQYGNKDIAFLTEMHKDDAGKIIMNQWGKPERYPTDQYLSIGNDLKAAATDCLKKCAAELGVAADIYNKDDFKEILVDVSPDPELDDLRALYELKEEVLSPQEQIDAQRIIKGEERNSYKKLFKLLQSK